MLSEEEIELLQVLARGLTDEAAAAKLKCSRWTLRRRLRRAMDELGARSRFQAGCLFAQLIVAGGSSRTPDDTP